MKQEDSAVLGGYQRTYSDNERMPDKDYYKKPRYPLWMECYKVFLMFSFPVVLMMFIGYYLGGTRMAAYPALMLLFPILSTLIRRLLKNLLLFLLGHALLVGYLFLSPHVILTLVGVIYVALLIAYGLVRQLSHEMENDLGYGLLLAAFFVMGVTYVLCDYLNKTYFLHYLIPMTLLYTVLYLFYEHRTSVMNALKAMDKKGNFSVPQILRFNSGMFVIYLILIAAAFTALYFAGLGDLIRMASRLLILLIKRILRALLKAEPTEQTIQEETELIQESSPRQIMGNLGPEATSPFWLFMQRVLVVVFIIGAVAALIYLAVWLYKRFNASYAFQGDGYEETKTFYKDDAVEETKMPHFSLFDRSFESRIRRQYYRRVKGAMGKSVFSSDTPQEVGQKVPSVREILPDYEQVRYDPNYSEEKGS